MKFIKPALVLAAFLAAACAAPVDAMLFSGAGTGTPTPPPTGALTAMTVTNPSGSTQTNMPFCVGLPLAATSLVSGNSVEVIDGDTGLPVPIDEVNRATDMNSAIRNESVCGVIASATGSQKKSLQINVVSGAPATGTDITVGEISAYMTLNGYSLPVTFTDINGVSGTWTADLQTALGSGNSGWVNKSTATTLGKYRSGGGIVTEYLIYSPVVKSGTPDGQLYVMFDVRCFKTLRTAVNTSTNPIRGCVTYALVGNGWLQQVSPVDKWYGISVGAGGASGSFPIVSPASNTLTITGTGTGDRYIASSASLFTANTQGQVITDGVGLGVVSDYTDSTHAIINVVIEFASTTVAANTFKVYGIGHTYMTTHKYRAVFGNSMPLVEDGNVYLGNAWNTGTLAGGPGTYIKSTGMMMNFAMTTAQATSPDAISNIAAAGNNPNSTHRGFVGPFIANLETGGQRGDIGVEPDWVHAATIRYDSDAANLIFKSADYWANFPNQVRDANTGLNGTPCNAGTLPTCAGTTQYTFDSRFGGTAIAQPGYINYGTFYKWLQDEMAHDPAGFYMAAVMSGDYFYIASQQMSGFYAWANIDSPATGMAKTVFVDDGICCAPQVRGQVWGGLMISNAALLTPDSNTVLGVTKAVGKQWQANQFGSNAQAAKTLYIDQTGPGLKYSTNGPHYTNEGNDSYSSYMSGYGSIALGAQYERGMLDANGIAFKNWYSNNQVAYISNTTDLNISGIAADGYLMIRDQPNSGCIGTRQSDWAGIYKANALTIPRTLGQRGPSRVITSGSTMTLSATSGTGITATFNGSHNWFTATSWYVGGWIQTLDGGLGRITAINNANQAVISTAASATYYYDNTGTCVLFTGAAFGSTLYTSNGLFDDQANIVIPNAAPGDPAGPYWAQILATGGGVDYYDIVQATLIMGKDQGVSGAAAACATSIASTGGTMLTHYGQKWWIDPRTGPC